MILIYDKDALESTDCGMREGLLNVDWTPKSMLNAQKSNLSLNKDGRKTP
jgi:hypothetical protein